MFYNNYTTTFIKISIIYYLFVVYVTSNLVIQKFVFLNVCILFSNHVMTCETIGTKQKYRLLLSLLSLQVTTEYKMGDIDGQPELTSDLCTFVLERGSNNFLALPLCNLYGGTVLPAVS